MRERYDIYRIIPPVCVVILAAYSAVLMGLEFRTSQETVRPYFTDIEGDVLFYAVNTTLSSFLLAGAAMFLAFAALGAREARGRQQAFFLSQALMFALLASDDRFLLHERIGYRLGVEDHFVMATWAAAEIALLALFCRPAYVTARMARLFAAGAGFFVIMFAIDAFVDADLPMRLSAEDLAKTWGAAMFFAFAWCAALSRVEPARPAASVPMV